jgi:hypothetical protein
MNTSREARNMKIYLKRADHEPPASPRPSTGRGNYMNQNSDYYNVFKDTLESFNRKILVTKIQDRETNTLTVSKSLDKFKSTKLEKLRTRMENQLNFMDTRTNYGIMKVNENNLQREKIISNNLHKFINNERPEKIKLMDNYVR